MFLLSAFGEHSTEHPNTLIGMKNVFSKNGFISQTVLMILFICMLLPGVCCAQNKMTKRQQKRWDEIKQEIAADNFSKAIPLCYKAILKCGFNDSIAFLARSVVAEYSMATDNLNAIYESSVYFRNYLKSFPASSKALRLKERLDNHYSRLLALESSNPLPTGVYVSETFSDKCIPDIAIELYYDNCGKVNIELLPCCELSKKAKSYSQFGVNNELGHPATLLSGNDSTSLCYYAEWGDTRIRQGNQEIAGDIKEGSFEMSSEMNATIVSSAASTSDKLLASVTTSLITGLFDVAADELSKKTVKSHAVLLRMDSVRNGVANADIQWAMRKVRDGEEPVYTESIIKTRLHRLYPHDELTFVCIGNASIIDYRSNHLSGMPHDVNLPAEYQNLFWKVSGKRLNPLTYPTGNKYGYKMKRTNLPNYESLEIFKLYKLENSQK